MITLYGINNCDTVKKSQKWLIKNGIDYLFYDFKKQDLTEELLKKFISMSDWSVLLNKRSTTFRNLPDSVKNNLTDEVLFEAVLAQPTLLKRPLLHIPVQDRLTTESEDLLQLGFKEEQYKITFNI